MKIIWLWLCVITGFWTCVAGAVLHDWLIAAIGVELFVVAAIIVISDIQDDDDRPEGDQ